MIQAAKNVFVGAVKALVRWAYYRAGWARAVGLGCNADWRARVSLDAKLDGVRGIGVAVIGREVSIRQGSYISSGIVQAATIGRYCSIGPNVLIGPSEHNLDFWTTSPYEAADAGIAPNLTTSERAVPLIGDGVWIGANVVILRGVEIGERAAVAAGSVVTRSIPSGQLWGGIPAKFIRLISAASVGDVKP